MRFLTPAERRLLASLEFDEATVLHAFFEELDAHLVDEPYISDSITKEGT